MQVYKYVGFDTTGRRITGELSATSSSHAEEILESRSVILLSIEGGGGQETVVSRPRLRLNLPKSSHRPVKTMDAAIILRNLAVMTENGVTLVDALDGVIDSIRNDEIKEKLNRVRADIVGGKSLSSALRSETGLFPSLVCDMARVAEDGGQLATALGGAATYLERVANLRRKIMNALLYPSIMAFIAFLTVAILVILILPNFNDIFIQMSVELPTSTKVLMATGTFMHDNFFLFLGLFAAGWFGIKRYIHTEVGSQVYSRTLLKIPVIGELVKKLSISRALQSISALISSNVSLIHALDHGARVAGNYVVSSGLLAAKDGVEQGSSLSEALLKSPVFPKVLTQMVVAGERTGKLSQMLHPVALAMEEEADSQLRALTSIIEPIIVVAMGVAVGFVTLAIVVPIFSIADNF